MFEFISKMLIVVISTALNAWIFVLLSATAFNYHLSYARAIAILFLVYSAGMQFQLGQTLRELE